MTISTSESKLGSNFDKNYESEESAHCATSPIYYLSKYAWIQTRTNPPKTIKWEPWPYLLDIIELYQLYWELIICKARQEGISWEMSGIGEHCAKFSDSAKVMYFSQGERESWEMVRKSRFINEHSPEWLRASLGRDTRELLEFAKTSSLIEGLPSTEKAGRSTDATLLIRDELAYHPYAKENFAAVGPTVDAGGKSIDLSTIDKLVGPDDAGYHFTERILRAKSGATFDKVMPSGIRVIKGGESGAVLIFLSWRLRPTRVEGLSLDEWFELRIKPKYPALKIEQEYPETLEEALRVPETTAFFNREALEDMLLEFEHPKKTDEINTYDGLIRIYKLPVVGRHYIAFTDPSDGGDPFATVVMDAQTYEGVAVAHGKRKSDEVAKIHDSLVRYYNNAYNTIEVNATSGGECRAKLRELQTPNMAPRRNTEGKIIKGEGWQTNQPLRDRALTALEESIRRRLITVHDKDAIEELKTFSFIDGKARAPSGMHDDWVMAWAGCWYLRKFYIPSDSLVIKSGKYRS